MFWIIDPRILPFRSSGCYPGECHYWQYGGVWRLVPAAQIRNIGHQISQVLAAMGGRGVEMGKRDLLGLEKSFQQYWQLG
jgi:hypothetical protein